MKMKPLTKLATPFTRHLSQKSAVNALPRPKGLPVVGTMLDLILAGGGPKLHLYVDSRHKQLGPVFSETLGFENVTFICNPRDMRKVFSAEGKFPVHFLPDAWVLYNKMYGTERGLFFMHGEEWSKYRQIMNKVMFKSDPSEGIVMAYKVATKDLVSKWCINANKPLDDALSELYKLSISYVIATLLGSSYPRCRDQLEASVNQLASVVHLIYEYSTKLNMLPAKVAATLRLPVWRRFVSSVDATLLAGNKLVTQLIPLSSDDGVLCQMFNEGISHNKIVSIVVDLILAAADTTPYTMVWALYLLGQSPEVQAEVAREVVSCDPQQWRTHPVLRAVMRETLRLYPAAPFLTRALAADTELSGYNVPAGEMIIMSVYTSGRSDLYFPEALRFWPQRWLRKGTTYQAVFEASASLPFAMGGRACIGRKVAESLISLTLAEVLSRMEVKVKKEVEMILMLVPVPSEPIQFYLSKRNI